MTSSSVGTVRSARKSALGSTVAGSIPRYRARQASRRRACDPGAVLPSASGLRAPRETTVGTNRVSPATTGRLARLDDLAERDHRRPVEVRRELADARSQRSSWAGASDRDELRVLRRPAYTRIWRSDRLGSSAAALRLLGRGGDDDRRRDAEGERDGGECRPGAGLIAGEVSQRQARRDRDVPGHARRRCGSPAGRGAGVPRIVATSPATMSSGLSRSDSARQPMPTAISTAAAMAEWRAGLGLGGRPESASTTGTRATARPGHQAAAVAPMTARTTAIAIRPHGRLSRSMRWSTADSSVGAKTTQSARPAIVPMSAAIVPTRAPFDKQHEAKVLLRRADGGEHAELAEPSLRDDREACGGDQRGQEQEDRGHGEHRQRLCRAADVASRAPWSPRRPSGSGRLERSHEGRRATPSLASTSTVTRSGLADEGETRANSSLSLRGFSTMPTTVRRRPSSARVDPISSRRDSATPSVTATWSRPAG